MSEAILRINESLDFGMVLQEVEDSARTLTGSRYGATTVLCTPYPALALEVVPFDLRVAPPTDIRPRPTFHLAQL